MDNDKADPWLAPDKFQHIIFCFSLTLLFSALASCSRHPLIRTYYLWVGCILSLLAGAAKEAADHLGFFSSAGASFKDAIADVIGVLIGMLVLYSWRRLFSGPGVDSGRTQRFLPVWVDVWWTYLHCWNRTERSIWFETRRTIRNYEWLVRKFSKIKN